MPQASCQAFFPMRQVLPQQQQFQQQQRFERWQHHHQLSSINSECSLVWEIRRRPEHPVEFKHLSRGESAASRSHFGEWSSSSENPLEKALDAVGMICSRVTRRTPQA
jgi:hypothetical protein